MLFAGSAWANEVSRQVLLGPPGRLGGRVENLHLEGMPSVVCEVLSLLPGKWQSSDKEKHIRGMQKRNGPTPPCEGSILEPELYFTAQHAPFFEVPNHNCISRDWHVHWLLRARGPSSNNRLICTLSTARRD